MSRAGVGLAHLLTYYRDLCLHRLPIGAVKHPPVKAHRISRFDHGAHRGKVVVEELVQDVGAGPFVLVGFDSQEKAAWKTATQWPVGRSANAEIKSKPKRSMCFIFLSLSLSLSLYTCTHKCPHRHPTRVYIIPVLLPSVQWVPCCSIGDSIGKLFASPHLAVRMSVLFGDGYERLVVGALRVPAMGRARTHIYTHKCYIYVQFIDS